MPGVYKSARTFLPTARANFFLRALGRAKCKSNNNKGAPSFRSRGQERDNSIAREPGSLLPVPAQRPGGIKGSRRAAKRAGRPCSEIKERRRRRGRSRETPDSFRARLFAEACYVREGLAESGISSKGSAV